MINNTIILVYEYYIIYYYYYITILWIPDYCFKYSVVDGRTIDVCAEINLAHVVVLKDCRVSSIWCVVSCTVIQRAPSWKCQPCIQTVLFDQLPTAVLQPLAEPEKTWKRDALWAVALIPKTTLGLMSISFMKNITSTDIFKPSWSEFFLF